MSHDRGSSRNRGRAVFEVVAVSGLMLLVGLTSYLREDVWFWDDATYLARGILPEQYGPPTWVDSPVYSGMYGVLGLLQRDPVSLYLLGRAVSAVLFVGCVWLAARLVADRWRAWTVAALAAMLPVTYIWPGVSAPASGLLIVAVVIAFRFPSPPGLASTAALTWVAAGSRPEFTWIAVALSAGAVTWWAVGAARVRQSSAWRAGVLTAILAIVPAVVLVTRYSTMFQRSAREWTAFSQHFALRNASAGQDSWQSAGDIAARTFPGADSVLSAALINPGAMAGHVGRNAVQLPVTLVGHALAVEPPMLLEPTLPKAAALAFLAGLVLAAWMNRQSLTSSMRRGLSRCVRMPLLPPLLALVGVIGASSLSMLVIYPRPHYLLLPIGLALVGAAAWLTRVTVQRGQAVVPIGTVAMLLGAFALVTLAGLPGRVTDPPPYEASLRAVQEWGQARTVVSGDWPVALFLPSTSYAAGPPSDANSVGEAFDTLGVNVVQLSAVLNQGPWGTLAGFERFYADPTTLGFRQIVPQSPIWVR